MESFEVFELVAFLYFSILFNIIEGIINKHKEVLLTQKFHKTNRTNKVSIYE